MRNARSFLLSTHPLPSVAVTLFSVMFAFGLGLSPVHIVLVGVAVLMQQFSVGLSNDWLDSARDRAVERTDKPVATQLIGRQVVRNGSFVCALLAVVTSLFLGVLPAAWMLLMLVVGWSYNLGLKANWSSVLPYAVGFGCLPVFVTLSQQPPGWPAWWIITAAALLGVAAHFANALPDLFDDRATGVRALPHLIGQAASAIVIAVTASVASLIIFTQSATLNPVVGWLGLTLTIALAVIASVLTLRPKPPRIIFVVLILAAMINVIMLVLGLG